MQLQNVFEKFLDQIAGVLPGAMGAVLVLVVGWFIALGIKKLVFRLLNKTSLDNKILGRGNSNIKVEALIAKLAYFIIMIIVLMIVLEMLGVSDVLDPLKNMINEFVTFVPNIIAALVIGFVGYILASIVSELVGFGGNLLEDVSNKLKINSNLDLSQILKKVVFVLIFIPALIAALDALQIAAISGPSKSMLNTFFDAIPALIAAALIITVFFLLGRYLTTILGDILEGLGLEHLTNKLGLEKMIGSLKLSKLLANIAFFFIMFTGIITAVEQLNFQQLSLTLTELLDLVGNIFFGLLVLAFGSFIANMVHKAISKSDTDKFLAGLARVAILGLFFAIALRTMGIANEIVNLAFGLTLGAVAVAVALSFGLGGKEAAGKQMDYILRKFRKSD